MKRIKLVIATDGSCPGNEHKDASLRAGGYAYVRDDGKVYSKGYLDNPTNNKSEAYAVLAALKSVDTKNTDVTIKTDSSYMVSSITKRDERIILPEEKAVYLKNGKLACNSDILIDIYNEIKRIESTNGTVTTVKVTGHGNDGMNNHADRLATAAAYIISHK